MMNPLASVPGLSLMVSVLLGLGAAIAQEPSRSAYLDGREHLLEERYQQALSSFRRVVSDFPTSDEADDAQFYIAFALSELGQNDQAIAAYDELLERWPDSARVERARSRRAELIARERGGGANDELIREIFDGAGSWALKRDTAYAMARKGNFAAADVLEEAMERESSGRQAELARILAPHAANPTARRILIRGLGAGRSSSVKMRTLQALEPVASAADVAEAVGRVLSNGSSSSVKQHAVQILSGHLDSPDARRAMSAAFEPDNSTSVQISACDALEGYLLTDEVRASVIRVYQGSTSSSVRLKCLESLEGDRNDLAAAEVLREAISRRGTSSSVRMRALEVAGRSETAAVRAVAESGLANGNSTSVQLRALQAMRETHDDESVAEALDALFQRNTSTSVLIASVGALANHMGTSSGPSALSHALSGRHSTSVQLKALSLAAEHVDEPAVRAAVLRILEDSAASTSVKLEAVRALRPQMNVSEVRRIVGAAFRASNSTSVSLKAVEALASHTEHADTRLSLVRALDDDFSTSVVLASIEALSSHVRDDSVVAAAFVRTMEDRDISSRARVRAGEVLFSGADAALKARIADAMEEVVIRAGRRGGRGRRDLLDDALDLLELIDAERAESLRRRYRAAEEADGTRVAAESTMSWPLWHAAPMM